MNRKLSTVLVALLCLCSFVYPALGCTTFCLKNNGENLFGKNYDWDIGHGMIFVNKRGVSKVSGLENEKNPAKWVSRYGSVTFNQYGWESPSGGMNEMGLAIELMWLDDTQYPKPDARPAIDVLEWIQFQLDTSATTAEVIRNSENVRISSKIVLHYLVNDRGGNTATIEFLNGKLIAHTGKDLPADERHLCAFDRFRCQEGSLYEPVRELFGPFCSSLGPGQSVRSKTSVGERSYRLRL